MFRSYLIIAIRNLLRNKLFSVINILGLAIGMAATLLITEFIVHELSYDTFHSNKDHIYRVIINEEKEGNIEYFGLITAGVSESIYSEFPEAISHCRFSSSRPAYFAYGGVDYYEEEVTYADSSLFKIFSFDLQKGDPTTCLAEPRSVVITDEVAEKIFGEEEPIGKVITMNNEDQLIVSGVMAKPPSNSSIQFDAVISFSTLYQMENVFLGWDGGWNYESYVLLGSENTPADMQGRFEDFMEKNINYKYREHGFVLSLILQPLEEIHLYSGPDYGLEGEGRLVNLFVLSSIAFFILLIACFNFMNLSTARSVKRAKEVGIRKVSGATRRAIVGQFLAESIFLSFVSLLFALFLVELFQPQFNVLIGRELNLFDQSGIIVVSIFIIMIIITGILAGSYPAFFMSRFQAIKVIKGNFVQSKGKPLFRNILVVIQFLISAFLISSTLIIQNQIHYLKSKPLGFDQEEVYVIPLTTEKARMASDDLKNRLNALPGVMKSGASAGIPGLGLTMNGYTPEGFNDPIMIHVMDVDDDYLDVMGIPIIQGNSFSAESGLDSVNILINESLVKRLGWDDPVGKSIHRGIEMKIIGVVQDFHFAPLNEDIKPLLFTQRPWNGFYDLSIKVDPGNPVQTMEKVRMEWEELFPDESFEHFSLEEYIADAYRDVSGLRTVFIYFAILAIIVACMGLLGLASYSTGQRSKEVGVRKVFGAENRQITIKLSSDFLKWVLLANILALPFAWWAMDTWLQNFAYRISISPLVILYTLLITLGLSLVTVIFQAMHLARSNPSDILKDE